MSVGIVWKYQPLELRKEKWWFRTWCETRFNMSCSSLLSASLCVNRGKINWLTWTRGPAILLWNFSLQPPTVGPRQPSGSWSQRILTCESWLLLPNSIQWQYISSLKLTMVILVNAINQGSCLYKSPPGCWFLNINQTHHWTQEEGPETEAIREGGAVSPWTNASNPMSQLLSLSFSPLCYSDWKHQETETPNAFGEDTNDRLWDTFRQGI